MVWFRQAMLATVVVASSVVACSTGSGSETTQVAKGPVCQAQRLVEDQLVVGWPADLRTDLEAARSRGLTVVRYAEGCSLEVLQGCTLPGSYRYAGVAPKREQLEIASERQLYAELPVGALGLEGKLAESKSLSIDTRRVGKLSAERGNFPVQHLQGSCEGATHVVASYTVGAYQLRQQAVQEAGAGAGVLGFGAKGENTLKRASLEQDGELAACERASQSDSVPPANCSGTVRIYLAPLANGVGELSELEALLAKGVSTARFIPGSEKLLGKAKDKYVRAYARGGDPRTAYPSFRRYFGHDDALAMCAQLANHYASEGKPQQAARIYQELLDWGGKDACAHRPEPALDSQLAEQFCLQCGCSSEAT